MKKLARYSATLKKASVFMAALGALESTLPTLSHASSKIESMEIISSSVWKHLKDGERRYVYPSGTPIVLESLNGSKQHLRIEQYFNQALDPNQINVHFHSRIAYHAIGFEKKLTGNEKGIFVGNKACDLSNGMHRCFIDLVVTKGISPGNYGLSLSYDGGNKEVFPIDSSFMIIVTDSKSQHPAFNRPNPPLVYENSRPDWQLENQLESDLSKNVVKIGLNSNVLLGTGVVVENPGVILDFFNRLGRNQSGSLQLGLEGKYVLTAAHLFPNLYTPVQTNDILKMILQKSSSIVGEYNISFSNSDDLNLKAQLMDISIESDLAVLFIPQAELEKYSDYTGGDKISGLEMASERVDDSSDFFLVAGYPIHMGGKLFTRFAHSGVDARNTSETANFGPLEKIKLASLSEDPLAHPGMSGGPIINSRGQIVALSIEKPNIGNSLIGINVSQLESLNDLFISNHCFVKFNPFERTVTLVSEELPCSYNGFGTGDNEFELRGKWMMQEVYEFSSNENIESLIQNISGQTIIHGHTIIGKTIWIDGNPVFEGELDVFRQTIDEINSSRMSEGFLLDPKSFSPLTVKGIRINSGSFDSTYLNPETHSKLVVAIKDEVDGEFREISSVRDFTLWLGKNAQNPAVNEMICVEGADCSSN